MTEHQAWSQVEKAKVPPALQEVAFKEAVALLTGSGGGGGSNGRGRATNAGNDGASVTPKKRPAKAARKSAPAGVPPVTDTLTPIGEDEFFEKIEDETGVPKDKLERVFHLENGLPQLSVKSNQLGSALKERMETIAKVLCVARAVAYSEDGTSMRILRAECRRLRSLDEKDVNKYLSEIDGLVYVGPPRDKRLKVRPAAEAAFPAVIDKLLGVKAVADDKQS